MAAGFVWYSLAWLFGLGLQGADSPITKAVAFSFLFGALLSLGMVAYVVLLGVYRAIRLVWRTLGIGPAEPGDGGET
jgi:hypothetical protein